MSYHPTQQELLDYLQRLRAPQYQQIVERVELRETLLYGGLLAVLALVVS